MSKPDQTFYYLEQLCEYLIFLRREIDFGQGERHYRLDETDPEFDFFAKCPEEILDVRVHHIYGGELHQVDTISHAPRRFFFTKTKLTEDELEDTLMFQKFLKTGDVYVHKYMIAFIYKEGIVFASKNCRKYLGA
jgi:hypothetical protein